MTRYRLGMVTAWWTWSPAPKVATSDIRLSHVLRHVSLGCGWCWGRAFAAAADHTSYGAALETVALRPNYACEACCCDPGRRRDYRFNYYDTDICDFDNVIADGDLFGLVVFGPRTTAQPDGSPTPPVPTRCFYGIKGYVGVTHHNPGLDQLYEIQPDAVVGYGAELAPFLEIARLSSI